MEEVKKNVLNIEEIKAEISKVNLTDDMKGIKEHDIIKKLFEDNYNTILNYGDNYAFFRDSFPKDGDLYAPAKVSLLNKLFDKVEKDMKDKTKNNEAGVKQNTATMLAMNREDIVNENNTEITRFVMNAQTRMGFACARTTEAIIMSNIIKKQNEEIKTLKSDNENLAKLVKCSTVFMKKNNDLEEKQFKQAAKEINSRTNITGLHVELSKPVVPNKVNFSDLEKLMDKMEQNFDEQYNMLGDVLNNADVDLNKVNDLYTNSLENFKRFI